MKKVVAIIVSLSMLIALAIPVSAAWSYEADHSSPNSGGVTGYESYVSFNEDTLYIGLTGTWTGFWEPDDFEDYLVVPNPDHIVLDHVEIGINFFKGFTATYKVPILAPEASVYVDSEGNDLRGGDALPFISATSIYRADDYFAFVEIEINVRELINRGFVDAASFADGADLGMYIVVFDVESYNRPIAQRNDWDGDDPTGILVGGNVWAGAVLDKWVNVGSGDGFASAGYFTLDGGPEAPEAEAPTEDLYAEVVYMLRGASEEEYYEITIAGHTVTTELLGWAVDFAEMIAEAFEEDPAEGVVVSVHSSGANQLSVKALEPGADGNDLVQGMEIARVDGADMPFSYNMDMPLLILLNENGSRIAQAIGNNLGSIPFSEDFSDGLDVSISDEAWFFSSTLVWTEPEEEDEEPGDEEPPVVVAPSADQLVFQIGSLNYTQNGISRLIDSAAPFIDAEFNRTMVPLSLIAQAFGYEVGWDGETATASIDGAGVSVSLVIGQELPGGFGISQIVNDRTFVPLAYVLDQFGATVDWDGDTQTITITR